MTRAINVKKGKKRKDVSDCCQYHFLSGLRCDAVPTQHVLAQWLPPQCFVAQIPCRLGHEFKSRLCESTNSIFLEGVKEPQGMKRCTQLLAGSRLPDFV